MEGAGDQVGGGDLAGCDLAGGEFAGSVLCWNGDKLKGMSSTGSEGLGATCFGEVGIVSVQGLACGHGFNSVVFFFQYSVLA